MKDLLVELETRFAFMDDTVNALNDEVAAHEQKIERLERALLAMQKQLQHMEVNGDDDDQIPPHY